MAEVVFALSSEHAEAAHSPIHLEGKLDALVILVGWNK